MAQILIIDDNKEFRKLLRETLGQAGHQVLEASNGQEGIDLYCKEQPDLVITDIVMPGVSGIQVVSELQKDFPGINIFAVSGGGKNDAQDYLDGIVSYGNVRYVFEKPFDMNELLEAVRDVVG